MDFRNYLLGKILHEDEKEVIEEKLMLDKDFFQEFLIEEEELIQDYADGNLDFEEQRRFKEYFLISEERHEKLRFAITLRKYLDKQMKSEKETEQKVSVKTFFSQIFSVRQWSAVLGGLIIIFLSAFFVWKFYIHFSETETALASLNRAFAAARPLETRITGFNYAPHHNMRGNDQNLVGELELENAKTILFKKFRENPTAEIYHAVGRFYLAEGDFDRAIELFEKGLRKTNDNAKLHTDLGTAWLEKGKTDTENSLKLYASALEEFETAIELNKNLEETLFNKAICLQLMDLPNQTKNAWEEYLKLDSASKWAKEAETNLGKLRAVEVKNQSKEELLREFLETVRIKNDEKAWQLLSRNREMITGKHIPQQLAVSYSSTKNSEYLEALRYAGKIEKERTGDPFWHDTAEFYVSASQEKILEIEKAHSLIVKSYELNLQGGYAEALNNFLQAREIFSKTGNIREANLAAYWIGFCHYTLLNLTESKRELKALVDYCKSKNYRWLLAHALFWEGVNYGSENQSSKTIEIYKEAFQASDSVFDNYNSQKILSETAEEYRLVGRLDQALSYLQKSLSLSHDAETSLRQKSRTYNNLVRTFYALKSYPAALAYQKENVNLLEQIKDFNFHYSSTLQLGKIQAGQKNYSAAMETFLNSRQIAENVADKSIRDEYIAHSILEIGNLQSETGEYENALTNYDEAVRFYDTSEYQTEKYTSHKGRLFCYLALKDDEKFQSELVTVLELSDKYRKEILDEENRNAFFDNEQSVYDIAVDYEFQKGNYQKAFDYAEKSRSRSLFDLIENGGKVEQVGSKLEVKLKNASAEPLSAEQLRQQIPDRVQILQYTVLKDKILIWLVSKSNFEVVASKITDEDLQEKVSSYLNLVSKLDEESTVERQKLSAELYQILISPMIDKISTDKEICLIPDKSLFRIPFSSLISPKNGQFFIAEQNLFFAPSANVFLVFSKNADKLKRNSAETILSVGNPAFDREEFPELENLPEAEKEALEVAKLYRNPTVLIGKDAQKEKVKEDLQKADVFHFAGHYVVDEHSPLLSSFILSQNSPDKEKHLANYELIGESLTQTKLVVLSACETGMEGYRQSEGMIGASRTFLAAGIPQVVASQWKVDSRATGELMMRFHKYRKLQNLPTVQALRQAQLDMINSQDGRYKNPYYWSAFMTLGGYSQF